MKTHTYSLTIREHHLDTFGHVNNATYLQLYEEARWDLLNQGGFGLKHIQTIQQGPIILEIGIKFLRELHNLDQIVIESTCREYQKSTTWMDQRMINPRGEIASEASFKFALFDLKSRRIIRPTTEWIAAISG